MPLRAWEAFYEISDLGEIRRIRTSAGKPIPPDKQKIVRGNPQSKGHLEIVLSGREGAVIRRERTFVHRLVLETFVGEAPPGKPFCLHWDDDPSNNRLENLRWGPPVENVRDAIRNGRNTQKAKTACPRGHDLAEPNLWAPALKKGSRTCLACRRVYVGKWATSERASGRRPTENPLYAEYADIEYARIVGTTK